MPTFLPPQAQKLLVATSGAYTRTAKDMTALFHFGMGLLLPCKDGSATYTGMQSRFEAVYLFLGDVIGSQKYNYLDTQDTDAAYRLTSTSLPLSSATGAAFNGSTQYLNTHYNPSINSVSDNIGLHINERTARSPSTGTTIGGIFGISSYSFISISTSTASMVGAINGLNTSVGGVNFNTTLGLSSIQRVSGTIQQTYKNGVFQASITSGTQPRTNREIFIGATGNGGTGTNFSALNTDFAAIQKVLITDVQVSELYTLQSKFNTTLGR